MSAFFALVVLAVYVWRSNSVSGRIGQDLDRWCVDESRLGALLIPLVVAPLLIAAALWTVLRTPIEFSAYRTWAPDTFPLLNAVVSAILPLLCLLLLTSLEAAAYLGWRYRLRLLTAIRRSHFRV